MQTPAEAARMAGYTRLARQAGARGLCPTCAFRPGTEAHASSATLELLEDVAESRGTFLCHHGGTLDDCGGYTLPDGARPCRGFLSLQRATAPSAVPRDQPGGQLPR